MITFLLFVIALPMLLVLAALVLRILREILPVLLVVAGAIARLVVAAKECGDVYVSLEQ